MSGYSRSELDEMILRWSAITEHCATNGDWRPLAEMYTENATYGWNNGPHQDFMAVGRAEIREIVYGQELDGFEGWRYPYYDFVVDDRRGRVIGLWRQVSPYRRPDGRSRSPAGLSVSFFRYGGDFQWSWQRDIYDMNNISYVMADLYKDGLLPDGARKRFELMRSGGQLPGYYQGGAAPVPLW